MYSSLEEGLGRIPQATVSLGNGETVPSRRGQGPQLAEAKRQVLAACPEEGCCTDLTVVHDGVVMQLLTANTMRKTMVPMLMLAVAAAVAAAGSAGKDQVVT